jgi:hypothetical protein
MRWNDNMRRLFKLVMILQIILLSGFLSTDFMVLANNISVNIVIANPSQSDKQSMPVKHMLPADISKNDIIDHGALSIDYDLSTSSYYVYGNFMLEPGETRTLKVIISDVWKIPEKEIVNMKNILERKVAVVENPEHKRSAELVANTLKTRLDSILEYQRNNAGDIEARMRMHSINMARFQEIKKNIFSLDASKDQASEESESALYATLMIEATNVSDVSSNVPVKYYLPKELLPEYIEHAAGFDVKYDPVLDQFYLFQDLLFAPNQVRLFTITFKNVWVISEQIVTKLVEEASEINAELAKTTFAEEAQALFDIIKEKSEIIIESQKNATNIKDYIAAYRSNQQRLKEIEDYIEKMRALLDTVKSQSKTMIERMMEDVGLFRAFRVLADKIFQQNVKPEFIWKIIMSIVIFVLALTAFFYGIWTIKLRKEEKKKYKKV